MKIINSIEFHTGSREELLPDFFDDFPYIATCAELDKYEEPFVPWHWHKTVELFYMESGTLEYYTPKGKILFPAGSGGIVNSNVLHMTKLRPERTKTLQLLHIFDTSFIAGEHGSRIEQKYIMPMIMAQQLEIIALYPDKQKQKVILDQIKNAFYFSEQEFGYEVKLREALTKIWLALFELSVPVLEKKEKHDKTNDKIKMMMVYIHEHFAEKIFIPELAAAAFLSERECFRMFQDYLHMTPVEYIKSYRLQTACQMLAKGQENITSISHACGLGSSSYFGKVFRERMGCTPVEYRLKWLNSDI
ncbi:MAG: helix-turn-helix domain-containing protein [Clostridium sp.]|nr:helix-turn-helix domain-containing protein [Clostridium sp.]